MKSHFLSVLPGNPLLWDENLSNEPPYFDSMNAGQHGIISNYGFNALLFNADDKPLDIESSCVGMNHFDVTMTDDSYIGMQEFMITNNLRKTETDIVIKNIPAETIIKIMAEIDRGVLRSPSKVPGQK